MDHAVTWKSLADVGFIVLGFIVLLFGAARVFGAGMSSNPQMAKEEGNKGCWTAFVGLCLMILALVSMFR